MSSTHPILPPQGLGVAEDAGAGSPALKLAAQRPWG